jgi:hypothetical protein
MIDRRGVRRAYHGRYHRADSSRNSGNVVDESMPSLLSVPIFLVHGTVHLMEEVNPDFPRDF